MTIEKQCNTLSIPLVLGTFLLLMTLPLSTACPESCFCIDVFVTCSDFTILDTDLLPVGTDTLILTRGVMDEIKPGFLAKATNLKMLELNSINAKTIKSGAFADLNQLDLFSITSSTFDVVETESFRGLTEVSKFHISDSRIGTLGKRAFAQVNNVVDFRIWSSSFDVISDETFYKLSDIISFQLYENNITSLGSNLFLAASDIDDITIYKNRIQSVSENVFRNIKDVTNRLILHANVFACSCDMSWVLYNSVFKTYLASNECIFPDQSLPGINTFRMADVTREALCPGRFSTDLIESTPGVTGKPTVHSRTEGVLVSTENLMRLTNNMLTSTVPTRMTTTILYSTSSFPTRGSSLFGPITSLPSYSKSSTDLHMQEYSSSTFFDKIQTLPVSQSTSSSSQTTLSSLPPVKSTTTEISNLRLLTGSSTESQSTDEISEEYIDNLLTTPGGQTAARDSSTKTNIHTSTGDITQEGLTAAIRKVSIDDEHAKPYSTSAIDMATSIPDNASSLTNMGNWVFTTLLSGLCILLVSTP